MSNGNSAPPTPRKLRKAREEGDVAKSRDVTAAAVVTVGFLWLFSAHARFAALLQFAEKSFSAATDFRTNNVLVCAREALELVVHVSVIALTAIALGAAVAEVGQVGFRWSPRVLSFDWTRLGLIRGLRRILGFRSDGRNGSSSDLPWQIFKSALTISALGGLGAGVVVIYGPGLLKWQFQDAGQIVDIGRFLILRLAAAMLVALYALAALDAVVVRRRWIARLRMDAAELKKELKETEGDPEIKATRKRLYREIAAQELVQSIRRAKLLVVGKTE